MTEKEYHVHDGACRFKVERDSALERVKELERHNTMWKAESIAFEKMAKEARAALRTLESVEDSEFSRIVRRYCGRADNPKRDGP